MEVVGWEMEVRGRMLEEKDGMRTCDLKGKKKRI